MNYYQFAWIPLFVLLFIIIASHKKEINKLIISRINRRQGESEMRDLAKMFIGKDVLINTVSSGTVDGILKEVSDNAVLIEKDGKTDIVNLDFVIRLREYPVNKKGKRKSVVLE